MTEVNLVSQMLKLQLIFIPSRSTVIRLEEKTSGSSLSLFSKSMLFNQDPFLILFQVNEN